MSQPSRRMSESERTAREIAYLRSLQQLPQKPTPMPKPSSRVPPHPLMHADLAPWWLYLVAVPLLSFLFLIIGIVVRILVGLPIVPAKSGGEFLAWVGYTVAWIIYAIAGHKQQGYFDYLPWSVLVLCAAIGATFLIP